MLLTSASNRTVPCWSASVTKRLFSLGASGDPARETLLRVSFLSPCLCESGDSVRKLPVGDTLGELEPEGMRGGSLPVRHMRLLKGERFDTRGEDTRPINGDDDRRCKERELPPGDIFSGFRSFGGVGVALSTGKSSSLSFWRTRELSEGLELLSKESKPCDGSVLTPTQKAYSA